MSIALLALTVQVLAQVPTQPTTVARDQLDAMADACGAPRNWVAAQGREIIFRADPAADPKKLECVLRKISDVVAMSEIGIIGNAPASKAK